MAEPVRPPKSKEHLPALTGLRFFLAVWVVFHHLTGKGTMMDGWASTLPAAIYGTLHSGFFAVGTFFVLSGFVLARSYSTRSWTRPKLIRYGAGRFARVYPVYVLSLVIVSPIILSDVFSQGPGSRPAGESLSLLANYGLVLQGWCGKLPVNWNTPAWSLSCEFFFYLLFPLVALAVSRLDWPKMAVVAGLALFLPTAFRMMGIPDQWKPIIHLGDFLIGVATSSAYSYYARTRPTLIGHGYWFYVPSLVLGAAVVGFPSILNHVMVQGNALRPLNALLVFGLALGGGITARALSTRLVVFLGQASYSLYILHIPVLWWYKRWWLYLSGNKPSAIAAFVFLPLVIAFSGLVFHFFEDPANRRIRKWVTART